MLINEECSDEKFTAYWHEKEPTFIEAEYRPRAGNAYDCACIKITTLKCFILIIVYT